MHPYIKFKSNASAAGWCDHDFSVNKDTGGWLYRSGMVWKLFVGTSTVRQDRCWGLKSGCYFSSCATGFHPSFGPINNQFPTSQNLVLWNHTLMIQNSVCRFLSKILAVWSSKLMMIFRRLRLSAAIIVFWSTQTRPSWGCWEPDKCYRDYLQTFTSLYLERKLL